MRARRVSPLLVLLAAACAEPAPTALRANVYIPRGSSLAAVTDSLVAHRVVTSSWQFRMYARVRGLARRVRPGLYEFAEGERWTTIVSALESGRTHDFLFTVPEGLTVAEIADLAAEKLRLARDSIRTAVRDSFLAAARDPALRQEFGIDLPRGVKEPLEGYLLPETYRVAYDETPRDLVMQMTRQFFHLWDTAWDRRAEELDLTRHQAVTLASIVESEARIGSERRLIAGVYLNRLRRRMLLQADPTVIYALDKPVRRVLFRHLKIRSPYNTYLHPGLPPGPISNPGRASLEATLNPQEHNLLFFVARPDGRHMFSRTPGEHVDSVAVSRVLRTAFEKTRDSLAALGWGGGRDTLRP
ncbi:MAG: endolytic transglycosylase MltG [Gemmatimonadales bacterium]|nr:endolytic transglycosylase MltG [Gemmatimonadales bacterium]